jgi:signal peptidase I
LTDYIPPAEPQPEPTAPSKSHWKDLLREVLETLGLAVVLFIGINLISARVRVEGHSMLPTLNNGQYVLVSRLSYRLGDFHRGDVIVFRPPMYPEESFFRHLFGMPGVHDNYEDYIKRIIGLPGEKIRVQGGVVTINDVPLAEDYIAAQPEYDGEWTVPEGQLFVLGDNRNNSADSHQWGYLPQENVLGKALVIYWPLADWMVLSPGQPVSAAP